MNRPIYENIGAVGPREQIFLEKILSEHLTKYFTDHALESIRPAINAEVATVIKELEPYLIEKVKELSRNMVDKILLQGRQ